MRGFYGIGVFHGKNSENIGTLFRSAHCFGADFLFTIGKRYQKQYSDTLKTHRHIRLYHYRDLRDLYVHLPLGCRLIGIEMHPEARPLPGFIHPQQACYLLGAEDHGLNEEAIRTCHMLVEIPGAKRCLNVSTAGSIVIYDRTLKMTEP